MSMSNHLSHAQHSHHFCCYGNMNFNPSIDMVTVAAVQAALVQCLESDHVTMDAMAMVNLTESCGAIIIIIRWTLAHRRGTGLL